MELPKESEKQMELPEEPSKKTSNNQMKQKKKKEKEVNPSIFFSNLLNLYIFLEKI